MTTSTSWSDASPAIRTKVHSRASNYDGTSAEDLYNMIPEHLRDNPKEVEQWLDEHEVSHIESRSNGGSDNPDNLVWERSDANQARGGVDMSTFELQRIEGQNRMDAQRIEATHTEDSLPTEDATINDGAVIAGGAAIAGADAALGGAEILGGVASLGSVVLPLAGAAWAANKAAQTGKTTEGKLVRGGIAATAAWLALTNPVGIAAVGAYGVFKLSKSIRRNVKEIADTV